MEITNKNDEMQIYKALLEHGEDFTPSEIIDSGLLITDYSDVKVSNASNNKISGSCLIECENENDDEDEEVDVYYNAEYTITTNESGEVEEIEFFDVEVEE